MNSQLEMVLTDKQLKEKKLQLKMKRQHLAIIQKDIPRLIAEIEALRIEVGEPDTALEDYKKWIAEIKVGTNE